MEKCRENEMEVARAREKLSKEISRLVKSKNIYTNDLNKLREILKQAENFCGLPNEFKDLYLSILPLGEALLVKWCKYDLDAAWWYEKIGTYLAKAIERGEVSSRDIEKDIEEAISWLIVAYIIYLENKKELEASATITTLADFLEKELEIAIGRRRAKIAEARNKKIHWAMLEESLPFSLRKEYLSKMLITCAILWLLILNYEKASNLLTFAEKHKENFLNKHFDFCKQIVEAFRCGDWRMFKKACDMYDDNLLMKIGFSIFTAPQIHDYGFEVDSSYKYIDDIPKKFPYFDVYRGIWRRIFERLQDNFKNTVKELASPLVKPKIPRKIIISGIIGVSLGIIVGLTYSPFIGSIIVSVVFFILGLIVKRK